MLKEAIEKIQELSGPVFKTVDNKVYADREMDIVDEIKAHAKSVEVHSLAALALLIKNEGYRYASAKTPLFVRVADAVTVDVYTSLDGDMDREALYTATTSVPGFRSGYRGYEEFVIELRSRFKENSGRDYLLELLSRIDVNERATSEDNGVTQQVTVRQGVALKDNITVRPTVPLIPYRTFLEVEQPESDFLIRVDKAGSIGLFEADGGMWKVKATAAVADWLVAEFPEEIHEGTVVILP